VSGRGLYRAAVTEHEDRCVFSMVVDDFSGEFRDPFHVLAIGFTTGHLYFRADIRVEDFGEIVEDLMPGSAFVLAERFFAQLGASLDVVIGPEFEQRFGGLDRPFRVARIYGVEMVIFEPLPEQFGLRSARLVELIVVKTMGDVDSIAVRLTVADEYEGCQC